MSLIAFTTENVTPLPINNLLALNLYPENANAVAPAGGGGGGAAAAAASAASSTSASNIKINEYFRACFQGDTAKMEGVGKELSTLPNAGKYGTTGLMFAILSRKQEAYELAYRQNATAIHAIDKAGRNALFYACAVKDEKAVKFLLDVGVKVMADDEGGYAAFHAMHSDAIQKLLHSPTQKRMSVEGALVRFTFAKFKDNSKKAQQEIEKVLGRKVWKVPVSTIEGKNWRKVSEDEANQALQGAVLDMALAKTNSQQPKTNSQQPAGAAKK